MKVNNIFYTESFDNQNSAVKYEIDSTSLSDREFAALRQLIERSGILHYPILGKGAESSGKEISFILEALDGSRQIITSDIISNASHEQLTNFVKEIGRSQSTYTS